MAVKLNFKQVLLSCILPQDAAICQKIQFCSYLGHLLPDFKFDLEHFNGPQTKFIGDSLYKHPVCLNLKE